MTINMYNSPATSWEFDIGGRENIQPAVQQHLWDYDFLFIHHQAYNYSLGFYYGYGLSWLQTEYSTNNWSTSIFSNQITFGYTLGLEFFVMNNFYLHAGYRSGVVEAGIEGLFF